MAYEMTDRYLKILVEKFKENTASNIYYFDYRFVLKFFLPDSDWLTLCLPTSPTKKQKKIWEDKLLWLSDLSQTNCDDCITILLDILLMRWYIEKHNYICANLLPADAKCIYPDYLDKTFDDIFRLSPSYSTKYSLLDPSFLSRKIQDVQFINENLFYLSVGNWQIDLSPYRALFKYDLQNGIVYYISEVDGKFYRRDTKTGEEICLSDSKVLVKRLLLVLDDMSANNRNCFSPEDGERVFWYPFDDHYTKNKKNKDSQLELMIRSLRYKLGDVYDLDFVSDNYTLRARNSGKPIKKIKYCWVA